MVNSNKAIRIGGVAARGAVTHTGMRYVLGFSLLLAVIAMSGVWIIPALWG
jgi:hypothetical protein